MAEYKTDSMKQLLKTALTFILFFSFMSEVVATTDRLPTIKEEMQFIHQYFGVNFVYDSSLDLDIPYTGRPIKEIAKEQQAVESTGAGLRPSPLVSCLDALFSGTGIVYEVMKKYIVLTKADSGKKPKDYSILIEEQRDTLRESHITALISKNLNTTQTGFKKIEKKVFDAGFAILSSPDVIKTIQQLPGVASGTELLSGLYVRGGDGSDNLYLIDGVPLYQVTHLVGLFSSFNTDVTESVDFYKSGFPARYGGRLSSVVDVRTKEGDFNEYHGLFSIGLLDGRLQFEGPIVKGKTSFNIGLRRSWIDVVTEPACLIASRKEGRDIRIKYAFWDLNAGVAHKFSEDNKLSLNLYGGRDAAKFIQGENSKQFGDAIQSDEAYYNEAAIGMEWGNFVSSLNWNLQIADNHELEAKAYFSRYSSRFSFSEYLREGAMEDIINSTWKNGVNSTGISDLGLRTDFSWRPSKSHHIRYGAMVQHHHYSPEYLSEKKASFQGTTILDNTFTEHLVKTSFEPSVYIEDEITATDRLTANVGLRYSAVITEGKVWHGLEPRAALRFSCGDYTSVKLSYSEMVQNDHQISTNYLLLPSSFWMPSTATVAPGRSRQVSGGIYLNLPHNIKFNAETYFKTMSNLLEFKGKWGLYPPIHLWEEAMVVGKGRSWGLETELSWSDEKTSLTAYYTLSWSQRFFEEFYPEWYNDRNDNRHKLTLLGTRKFGKRFELYAGWNYHSGGYITAASQAIPPDNIGDRPQTFYEKPNNLRLPGYHRLDVGFNFRRTTKRGNESIWNLSLYNAYCYPNTFFAYIKESYEFTKENLMGLQLIGESFGIVPLLPSFSYILRF